MSVVIIGSGGGGHSSTHTADLLLLAQDASGKMTADEHARIVHAEKNLAEVIQYVLDAVAKRP